MGFDLMQDGHKIWLSFLPPIGTSQLYIDPICKINKVRRGRGQGRAAREGARAARAFENDVGLLVVKRAQARVWVQKVGAGETRR